MRPYATSTNKSGRSHLDAVTAPRGSSTAMVKVPRATRFGLVLSKMILSSRAARTSSPGPPTWPASVGAMITLGVALIGIGRPSVWSDEAATISAANRGLGSFVELILTVDAVHALYYLLMMPWIDMFGTSPLSIRTPSAIALTIGAFYTVKIAMHYVRIAQQDRVVIAGLASGVLYAVLPGIAWMGQEARGYAFGTACTMFALWSYERWMDTGDRRHIVSFTIVHTFAIYFTLYAAMVVPLYVLRAAKCGARPAITSMVAATIVAAGTLPLILLALTQQGQVSWIKSTPFSMAIKMSTSQYFLGPGIRADLLQSISVLLAIFVSVLVIFGLVRGALKSHQAWLLSWILYPMLLLLFVRLGGGEFYDERYLAFTAPALVVLIVLVVAACISRQLTGTLVFAFIAVLCLPILVEQHAVLKNGSNYRSASDFLKRADVIYFMDPSSRGITIAYPHESPASDPMLGLDREEFASLWGHNKSLDFLYNQPPSGSVAVVTRKNSEHKYVTNYFKSTGCTLVDTLSDRWNDSTLLDCPVN